MEYVLDVAKYIGDNIEQHIYVVDKFTVPVGTAVLVEEIIEQRLAVRKEKISFDVISNSEFLKKGSAVIDCMRPD